MTIPERRQLRMRADHLLSRSLAEAAQEHPGRPGEALRAMGWAFRAFALDHPALYTVLFPSAQGQGEPGPAGVGAEPVEQAASLLGQLGVAVDQRLHIVRCYVALLHGLVMLELAEEVTPGHPDGFFEFALDRFLGVIDTPGSPSAALTTETDLQQGLEGTE